MSSDWEDAERMKVAWQDERARAESAEAEVQRLWAAHERLLGALRVLADEFDLPRMQGGGDFGPFYAERLRDLLGDAS